MPLTRREALQALSALFAMPLPRWPALLADPLAGTILDFQAGRARGEWTAAEVAARSLERSYRWNRRLHCTDLLSDTVLQEARASDTRARRGALRGPLDGAPLFAKSIYDVAGLPTTASSREWSALFPRAVSRDAIEVERLRAAGAVVLGKTVADDFAYRGNGTSSLSGQVRNPYDPGDTKTPGGSSAGSAVAAACGIAFAGLGTDDGGSNRIPAQFTGVVGMKPTFGLVPRSGVIPTWPYLDTHGPLARFVADAALMLDAIAGPDRSDALALTTPWRRGTLSALDPRALAGARLGLVEVHVPRDQMSKEAVALFDRALADLRAAGAEIVPYEPPADRATVRQAFLERSTMRGDPRPDPYAPAPTANALLRYFERQGADARAMVRKGQAPFQAFYDVLPREWEPLAAMMAVPYEADPAGRSFARSRAEITAEFVESFRQHRLAAMIYPTMPFPAPRAEDEWPDIRTALGYGNWLGFPEVSVPTGLGSDGMPGGNLSFVGLPGTDARQLALAHAYELVSRRFVPPPPPA